MKMLLFVVAIAAVLFTEHCDAAEWEKFPYGGLMFQFNKEAKTWPEAKAACKANGGYLAEPYGCEIDKFIRDKIKSISQDWWIGGTDQEKEGQWKWQNSGASFGCFKNWYPDEPNNAGGNQGCLRYWKKGQWDDYYCNKKHPFICQKSSA